MVNGIAAAIELTDSPEIGIGSCIRMLQDGDRRSVGKRRRDGHCRKQIDVSCAGQMLTANAQITKGHGVIVAELPLKIETPLLRQRLNIIRRECINVDRASHAGGRSRQDVRVGRKIGAERKRLHLNAILRHSRSLQNAGSPPVEHSISAARDGTATRVQLISKSKTRSPVILIRINPAGIDSDRGQARIRILYLWIGVTEHVISDDIIERQTFRGAPGVLNVESDFVHIRVGEWAIRSDSGKSLRKGRRGSRCKVRIAVEYERSVEITREEIVDLLDIQIESELVLVRTLLVRQAFHTLNASCVRITRAEIIPSDVEDRCPRLPNLCFRCRRIRRAGLVVASPAESGFEHRCGGGFIWAVLTTKT